MWRPAHGATSKPAPVRPANGYGRPVGRPGPRVARVGGTGQSAQGVDDELADPSPCFGSVGADDVQAEVPAPVTR
jgi:hypothetical protein